MNAREISWNLYEMALDMDYLDGADNVKEELEILQNEIQSILDNEKQYPCLNYLLDRLANMNGDNYELINRMIAESEG